MNKITVRAFEMSDWEDVAELFVTPRCQRETLQLPYQSRDEIRHKLENPPPMFYRLVGVNNELNRVVGLLGLHCMKGRRSHTGQIGMFVHDDHQNQGVGGVLLEASLKFAREWLDLKRIELTVYTDNARAIHLYQKHGFVTEGTLSCYARREGVYVDAYTMAWFPKDSS